MVPYTTKGVWNRRANGIGAPIRKQAPVIASKAKQSRLGPRICGLVWIASLSLAMTGTPLAITMRVAAERRLSPRNAATIESPPTVIPFDLSGRKK